MIAIGLIVIIAAGIVLGLVVFNNGGKIIRFFAIAFVVMFLLSQWTHRNDPPDTPSVTTEQGSKWK